MMLFTEESASFNPANAACGSTGRNLAAAWIGGLRSSAGEAYVLFCFSHSWIWNDVKVSSWNHGCQ